MLSRRLRELVLLLILPSAGCSRWFQTDPDAVACQLASRPIDVRPVSPGAAGSGEQSQAPSAGETGQEPRPQTTLRPIPVPPEVPGAEVPPIDLRKLTPAERQQAIDRLLPPLPPVGENPQPRPSPLGRPLELSDLQSLAMANSPLIKQAAADVEAARGAMIQAGAYPNPTVGLEWDAIGEGNQPDERVTPGQPGGFVEQTIKTRGKLRLARAAAQQDLRNAEFSLRRAQLDVMTQVRSGYFAVLAARENMRVTLAFARFSEEIYRIQVGQLRGGEVAPYEPLQFRALTVQARATLALARHRYISTWKQLAAAMGMPGMPPAPLGGTLDMPIPLYRYDDVAVRILARHTDVLIARSSLERARYNLRLAQVTPCPDIDVRVLVQRDYTSTPRNVMTGLQVSGPIPVWNHNEGNIRQAEAQLVRASEEEHRVRDDLARQLADAFERYNLNRELLAPYRGTALPDLVRVLNGVFERYLAQSSKTAGEITFLDISTAQQNLTTAVTAYLQALAAQWQAVVDIAALLQTEDLFQVGGEPAPIECLPPLPDLDRLLPLPCHHPCSPLPEPALRETVDPTWPAALPPASAAPREEPYPERPGR